MSFEGDGSDNKQLGVLLAGYLEKQNPYGKIFRRRFVVLTQEAFHWFKVRTCLYFLFYVNRKKKKIIYLVKSVGKCH